MYHIVRSEDYDWIALYHDGALLHQGHSIQEEDLMKILGCDFTHEVWSIERFDEYGGRCPDIQR